MHSQCALKKSKEKKKKSLRLSAIITGASSGGSPELWPLVIGQRGDCAFINVHGDGDNNDWRMVLVAIGSAKEANIQVQHRMRINSVHGDDNDWRMLLVVKGSAKIEAGIRFSIACALVVLMLLTASHVWLKPWLIPEMKAEQLWKPMLEYSPSCAFVVLLILLLWLIRTRKRKRLQALASQLMHDLVLDSLHMCQQWHTAGCCIVKAVYVIWMAHKWLFCDPATLAVVIALSQASAQPNCMHNVKECDQWVSWSESWLITTWVM